MVSEDVMPLQDKMRKNFGSERAVKFQDNVAEALNAALEAIKDAKEKVGNEIDALEAIASGEEPKENDLSNMETFDEEPSEEENDKEEEKSDDEVDFDDIFASPEGRSKKNESISYRRADPDYISNLYNKLIETESKRKALKLLSERFSIDIDILKEIV